MGERRRKRSCVAFILLVVIQSCLGVEHNLPDNVELVDPKDLGLDGQIDLDKLLGNVKALPIDTNAISSALGKPGLKTQVLTVGFDGSEGLNLDDFELPQLKNDEHGPLAQAAFSSFKSFLKNSTGATQYGEDGAPGVPQVSAPAFKEVVTKPVQQQQQRNGGKRRTMMKRRKIVRVNGTTTTPSPPTQPPQPVELLRESAPQSQNNGPKVIELDPSQIEKLIASGKIGPPKSLTPGGPQVIELGQRDLDALLSSENGDEIKKILESGDTPQDFDVSQITGSLPRAAAPQQEDAPPTPTSYVTETSPPVVSTNQVGFSYRPTSAPIPTTLSSEASPSSTIPQTEQVTTTVTTTTAPPTTQSTTTGLPIIFQYSSSQDDARSQNQIPPQGIQGTIPLQFFSSHANGQQQARLVKTPTFELISAPPVSFSSSILPNQIQQQQQPQLFVQNSFNNQQQPIAQFIPIAQPFPQQQQQIQLSKPKPSPSFKETVSKIVPIAQTSSHTEQVKSNSIPNSNSNFIQNLHKVNLPVNSVKLVTPSPQVVHSVLNQVPASFQPSIVPNHVVSSPVLDPLRLNNNNGGSSPPAQSSFLRPQPVPQQNTLLEPFRNTQLFGSGPVVIPPTSRPIQPIRSPPPQSSPFVRFPTNSGILQGGGPNRFRTSESSNPFFNYQQQQGGFGNLVLNSFVAGDGLNYRGKSREDYQSPGI